MHPCPRADCNATFNRPYRLAAHILNHENKKAFTCEYAGCTKGYTSKSHLQRHYSTTHQLKEKLAEFKCLKCWKVYSTPQNLKRHAKTHTTYNVIYICNVCKQEYLKKHKLTAHMFEHTGVKGFSCDGCAKTFVTLHEKKRHLRHHKTFQCEECKVVFQRWSNYQEHRRNTHGGKDFICHHCGRNFKDRAKILRHLKIHNINNKHYFVCPVSKCNKFYTRLFNLKQHMDSIHENQMFDCNICNAKLGTKSALSRHKKQIHNADRKKESTRKERKIRKDMGIPKVPAVTRITGELLEVQSINDAENVTTLAVSIST